LDHGDIMFRENEEEAIFGSHGSRDEVFKRDALINVNKRWKLPVAYEVTGSIDTLGRRGIRLAIKEFAAKTCITFREKTSEDTDYISFIKDGGCWSYVGRTGGRQEVSIGSGCHHQTTVVHEIIHALGFFHEQSRPDRDDFITINFQNAGAGARHNFEKQKNTVVTTLGHAYDYASVMHYSRTAFSINGKPTIIAKRNPNQVLGRGYSDTAGMSTIDAGQLNVMYCGSKPVTGGPDVTKTPDVTTSTAGTGGTVVTTEPDVTKTPDVTTSTAGTGGTVVTTGPDATKTADVTTSTAGTGGTVVTTGPDVTTTTDVATGTVETTIGPMVTTEAVTTPRPVSRRRRRRRRRRRMFIRRRRACGDQKSVDKITAKSNDPIKQAQRNNEIKQKMDEAAEIVEEVKKALEEEEEKAGEEVDDWEDKFDEEDEDGSK